MFRHQGFAVSAIVMDSRSHRVEKKLQILQHFKGSRSWRSLLHGLMSGYVPKTMDTYRQRAMMHWGESNTNIIRTGAVSAIKQNFSSCMALESHCLSCEKGSKGIFQSLV